ncbi:inner membrane protein [Blastomonas natatoria]|uniref:Inner membrane protein n=1 Tax=Blastomonas natatoria TaxID=34015 RepID=A0A2V3VMS9_9SPHN|nr:mitofilin family membrane protein [Blastomonas natatoria]PXW77909.1 inner membrane protein [Blastomonas natatoria]
MNVDTSRQGAFRQGQGPSGRTLMIMLLLAFVGGGVLSGWIFTRSGWFDQPAPPQPVTDSNVITAGPPAPPQGPVPPAMAPGMLTGPVPPGALDQRVAELENRLSLINVQAQAASGNAGRAEGLLIAFAARRALDRASALGYLEGQLQLRFGAAQPNAVATIIRASKNPVTMDQLRAQLDEIGPSLVSGQGTNEGFWDALQREMRELFVIEQEGTVSQTPTQRVQRARRYLEAGRVEAALAEIEQLPGRTKADDWMAKARSYAEARRALDIIESAAILEPRGLRDASGQPIEQPSPLAPPAN